MNCVLCNEWVSVGEGLESHLREDLGYFVWQCLLCNARFPSLPSLRLHFHGRFSLHQGREPVFTERRDLRIEENLEKALRAMERLPIDYRPLYTPPSRQSYWDEARYRSPPVDDPVQIHDVPAVMNSPPSTKKKRQLESQEVLTVEGECEGSDEAETLRRSPSPVSYDPFPERSGIIIPENSNPERSEPEDSSPSQRNEMENWVKYLNGYSCTLCSYFTTKIFNQKRHMLKHKGIKPFQCRTCSYRASQKIHLATHEKKQHSRTASDCDNIIE